MKTRVEEFLQAPVAARMFVLADQLGFGSERLAEPATVTSVANSALRDLSPWTVEAPARRAQAPALARPLHDLVTTVLSDPRNAWWTAPLDRTAQLFLVGADVPRFDLMELPAPQGPNDEWETYAQKPVKCIFTSTELPVPRDEPIRSGAHTALATCFSDWTPAYPVRQARLIVDATARVYEINSAADWHDLVRNYQDPPTQPRPDQDPEGINGGPAPTWSAVAGDHDAVHLTFAGLLTGLYVPQTSGRFSTTLWAWDWESTSWLRSAFTSVTPMEDLREPPEDLDFRYPR